MPDPFEDLESRLDALARDLRRVEARLGRLEAQQGLPEAPGELAAAPLATPGRALPSDLSQGTLALTGRTLVALGGGYLIRATTDAGALPALAGVALGLAYALLWLGAADRAARSEQRVSAGFHGLTSGLIAYPLLWEAATRFHLLSPPAALMLLVLVFGVGMAVTTRRHLTSVAWVVTTLALGTTAGLLFATHHVLAALLALLAIAAVVEGLAFRDLWPGLRWPAAVVLDGGLLALVLVGSRPEGLPDGYPELALGAAVSVTLGLPALYLASIVARTLGRGFLVTPFELAQGTAALALGLGGAWELLATHGASTTAVGGVTLLLGALSYAAAFAFVERRSGGGRNFYFYSTVGLLLTLVGSRATLSGAALSFTLGVLALAAAGMGRHFARMTLRFHGALYVAGAALVTGLLAGSWRAFLGPAESFGLPTLGGWMAAATAFAAYAILASDRERSPQFWERLPQAVVAAVCAWIASGTLVMALVALGPPLAATPAVVATLRTGVLALLAVALGAAARQWALPELAWFVYPLLALGGLKLASEDLGEGRPATLFVSLVLYGGALIAAPRLMRRSEPSPGSQD